jgi:hypothetical protein
MNSFREVNNKDMLKRWYDCMEEVYLCYMTDQDKFHNLKFDNFRENILKSLPKQNKDYIQKQLDLIYDDFMKYTEYVTEKYYRNGFVDGVQLIKGCEENNVPF